MLCHEALANPDRSGYISFSFFFFSLLLSFFLLFCNIVTTVGLKRRCNYIHHSVVILEARGDTWLICSSL